MPAVSAPQNYLSLTHKSTGFDVNCNELDNAGDPGLWISQGWAKWYCLGNMGHTFPPSSSSCRAGSTDIPDPLSPLLSSLSLSYSSWLFCRTFQEAGVTTSVGLCPSGIGLPEGIHSCVFEEPGRASQLVLLSGQQRKH